MGREKECPPDRTGREEVSGRTGDCSKINIH